MTDNYIRELLGVEPNATREEIKHSYHRLAKKHHPDMHPEEKRQIQQLKMMALNEAYVHLISPSPTNEAPIPPVQDHEPRSSIPATAVGFHKDPSYAYYKQGFMHFSRALRGIGALHDEVQLEPGRQSYLEFANSLTQLRKAYSYFARVVTEFPASIWHRDSRIKQARIERFSEIYRRILENLDTDQEVNGHRSNDGGLKQKSRPITPIQPLR